MGICPSEEQMKQRLLSLINIIKKQEIVMNSKYMMRVCVLGGELELGRLVNVLGVLYNENNKVFNMINLRVYIIPTKNSSLS